MPEIDRKALGEDGQAHAEDQHRHIDVEVGLMRKGIFGQSRDDRADRLVSSDHSKSCPGNRKEQRFGQQLPHDLEASGANGSPCGELMLAGRASRQQQNRKVAAANRQEKRHRSEKQVHRPLQLAGVGVG